MNLGCMPSSFTSLYQQCFATFTGVDRKVVMIGVVAICWAVWKTRNKLYFLHDWSKLQKNVLQKVLQQGVEVLAKVAHE